LVNLMFRIVLTDMCTGEEVVDVDPSWPIDELARELRRKGVVCSNAAVRFYKRNSNGQEIASPEPPCETS